MIATSSTTQKNKPLSLSDDTVSGYVLGFNDDRLGSKLLAMGVLPGSKVEVLRKAPFGGGVVLKVDHHYLALRAQEAACILIK